MLGHFKYFWRGPFGNLNNSLQYVCLHLSGDDEQSSLSGYSDNQLHVHQVEVYEVQQCTFPKTLIPRWLTFCGTMDLLGSRGKETVTAAIFLIPCPWGPKFGLPSCRCDRDGSSVHVEIISWKSIMWHSLWGWYCLVIMLFWLAQDQAS